MRAAILTLCCLALTACADSASTVRQANENAITIMDRAGGFGDRGAPIAETHCAQYGKVAVFASEVGTMLSRRYTYTCQ